MLEDKKTGLKVAEDKEEAKWESVRRRAEEEKERNRTEIEINDAIKKLAEEKLKEMKKGRGRYIG